MPAPSRLPAVAGAAKIPQVLAVWGLALAMSAALVAAGQRRPDPLPMRGDWILVSLLAPALAVLAWLLGHWRLQAPRLDPPSDRGPDRRGGESSGVEQESV